MKRGWIVCGLGMALSFSAFAEDAVVYRWKDRDGRVNYGNAPPEGVRAEPVDASSRITVVPALAPTAPSGRQPTDTPAAAERLDRLERELEAERQSRRDTEAAVEQQAQERARRKIECEEKYRESCDEDGQPSAKRFIVIPARPVHRAPVVGKGDADDDRGRGPAHPRTDPAAGDAPREQPGFARPDTPTVKRSEPAAAQQRSAVGGTRADDRGGTAR
ncbi:DUF4124 domain-containing protein [Azoarcus sp. L1K30]|uniref:DUF4124 domain-containing protein n=1 Tax=Azoarcus sp. L1K30 TaxID=2820277 RepID=UPI001B84220F|nr:DUF4124 domain-containing protein [Azoarcus sp. L1K30]MBR0568878.1 DUF4124 domain-containing protein [Azoarcus sp. L1K30]